MDWLLQHQHEYRNFDFDVRVGPGTDPGPDLPDSIRDMALRLSRRRIDAVAHAADHVAVIEICQRPNLRALGQIDLYRFHYEQDFKPEKEVRPAILCRDIPQDVAAYLSAEGVIVWQIPA